MGKGMSILLPIVIEYDLKDLIWATMNSHTRRGYTYVIKIVRQTIFERRCHPVCIQIPCQRLDHSDAAD
jgi:hypothetical protein